MLGALAARAGCACSPCWLRLQPVLVALAVLIHVYRSTYQVVLMGTQPGKKRGHHTEILVVVFGARPSAAATVLYNTRDQLRVDTHKVRRLKVERVTNYLGC